MKSSRFRYSYRENSSNLHQSIGEILRNGSLSGYKIYQEYPVNKIDPSFSDGRCKFDWVILDLRVVIEVHGEQHYKPVRWSKEISEEEAIANFHQLQERDQAKKQAAISSGYTYLAISYQEIKNETIDSSWLIEKIKENRKEQEGSDTYNKKAEEEKKKSKRISTPDWAKDYKKKQYQRQKEWIKKLRSTKEKTAKQPYIRGMNDRNVE